MNLSKSCPPLLSVVIPTKNRYKTLRYIVQSILEWEETNYELVIQDNSYNNRDFRDFLSQYKNDHRLSYFHESKQLSAIENCDLAVSHAKGNFVCFIGDDDGIISKAIRICEWMQKNNVDAVSFNCASYTWPDMQHALTINQKLNGILVNKQFTMQKIPVKPLKEIEKIFLIGGQGLFLTPRLYHGIVSKNCLDALKEKTHSYFPGPVPDMSNAVALASFLSNAFYIDIPIIISGQSAESMSGKNSIRKHQGEISNEPSLPGKTSKEWDRRIPHYWSAPTIWGEAALKSAERVGNTRLLMSFNFANLYASCFAYNDKKYYPLVFQAMNTNQENIVLLSIKTAYCLSRIMIKRTIILINKILNPSYNGRYFSDIGLAIRYMEKSFADIKL